MTSKQHPKLFPLHFPLPIVIGITLLTVFTFNGSVSAQNQTVPKGTKVKDAPKQYDEPTGDVIADNSFALTNNGYKWCVYSDRDNNKSYNTATIGGAIRNSNIPFMHPFFVIDEKGPFLHVVEYSQPEMEYVATNKGSLPEGTKDYGWMKKDNLLLWHNALVQPNSGITLKAIAVVNDLDVLTNPKKYLDESSQSGGLMLFNDPTLPPDASNDQQINLAQFLFIYKKDNDNGAFLIGKSYTFGQESSKNVVMGWISQKAITQWADRVCIEPNWDDAAAQDRLDHNVKASLFQNEQDANAYYSGQSPADVALWADDPYKKRWGGEIKRFPVVNDYFDATQNQKALKTGFVSDILSSSGNKVVSVNTQGDIEGKYEVQRKKIATFNISFAIDASPGGTNNYLKQISQTITNFDDNIKNEFNKGEQGVLINYGAVVYRDPSQKDCNGVDMSVESMGHFTNNLPELTTWLDSKLNENPSCPDKDPDHQALYAGLNKTLLMYDQKTDGQSNLIIIIGSQGDNDDAPSADLSVIEQNAVHSAAEIVALIPNGGSGGRKFSQQIIKLARYISTNIDAASMDVNKTGYTYSPDKPPFLYSNPMANRTIWSFKTPSESPIYTYIDVPDAGSYLDQNAMKNDLDSNLYEYFNDINQSLSNLDSKFNGIGQKSEIKLDARTAMYLNRIGKTIDPTILASFASKGNFQFFIPAYCKISKNDLTDPVFKIVILMTDDEFVYLEQQLAPFSQMPTGPAARSAIYNEYMEALKGYYGKESAKKIQNKSLGELTQLITRLPLKKTNLLNKYTLNDLQNQKIVDDGKLYEITRELSGYYNKVMSSQNNGNAVRMENSGTQYWWVSQDDLP